MKVRPLDVQRARSSRNVPIRFVERLPDPFPLRRFAGFVERGARRTFRLLPNLRGNSVYRQYISGSQDRHALDLVSKFSNIARPLITGKERQNSVAESLCLEVIARAKVVERVLGQRRNIFY